MLIEKLKEHLEWKLSLYVKQTKNPNTYSYIFGRIDEIKDILEWIDDLSSKDTVEEMIRKIEENNCQSYYKYMDFNYEDLIKLRDLLTK